MNWAWWLLCADVGLFLESKLILLEHRSRESGHSIAIGKVLDLGRVGWHTTEVGIALLGCQRAVILTVFYEVV